MGLFKAIFISAAIYGAYKFLTEIDTSGKQNAEDFEDGVPDWLERAKANQEMLRIGNLPQGM